MDDAKGRTDESSEAESRGTASSAATRSRAVARVASTSRVHPVLSQHPMETPFPTRCGGCRTLTRTPRSTCHRAGRTRHRRSRHAVGSSGARIQKRMKDAAMIKPTEICPDVPQPLNFNEVLDLYRESGGRYDWLIRLVYETACKVSMGECIRRNEWSTEHKGAGYTSKHSVVMSTRFGPLPDEDDLRVFEWFGLLTDRYGSACAMFDLRDVAKYLGRSNEPDCIAAIRESFSRFGGLIVTVSSTVTPEGAYLPQTNCYQLNFFSNWCGEDSETIMTVTWNRATYEVLKGFFAFNLTP